MTDNGDKEEDILGDNWLTHWENKCFEQWDNDTILEDLTNEHQRLSQKLFLSFQNSASAIALLYKEGSQRDRVSLWIPFQNSASSVTTLYKDSCALMKQSFELGNQFGHYRRTKELMSWLKKKRRRIRREELVAFLAGKPVPVRHRMSSPFTKTSSRLEMNPTLFNPADDTEEPDLQPFRDALALHGLNGAMSNVTVSRRTSPNITLSSCATATDDFPGLILDEFSRRCDSRKRTMSSDGRNEASGCHKRNKICRMETEDLC